MKISLFANRNAPKYTIAPGDTKGRPPVLKGLLVLFFTLLGLLILRLATVSFREGWLPLITLLVALGLVTAAAIEVIRAR